MAEHRLIYVVKAGTSTTTESFDNKSDCLTRWAALESDGRHLFECSIYNKDDDGNWQPGEGE